MIRQFETIDQMLRDRGFAIYERSTKIITWARESQRIVREELGLQCSSLEKGCVVGTLRISLRSTLWDGTEAVSEGMDGFVDALTVEWGANGVFPYGWQKWETWPDEQVDAILRSVETVALPWLEFHAQPANLAGVLEREVTEGIPECSSDEPVQRGFLGRLLLGAQRPSAQQRFYPRGHKQRLAQLYYEMGDLVAASKWARAWLQDMKGWTESSRYERRIEQLENQTTAT